MRKAAHTSKISNMPPKVDKAKVKEQEKAIEDKTFGMKNKNKSAKVQKFISGLKTAARAGAHSGGSRVPDEFEKKESAKKEEQRQALLKSLYGSITQKVAPVAVKAPEVDEKQVAEPDKINPFVDRREAQAGRNKTDIVCKYFMEAVENRIYGWFWVCPNGGDACMYRHCLPAGYELKNYDDEEEGEHEHGFNAKIATMSTDEMARLLAEDELTIAELVECLEEVRAMHARDHADEVKLGESAFKEWLSKNGYAGVEQVGSAKPADKEKSGRELFALDPSLFQDDEEADDESTQPAAAGDNDNDDDPEADGE